MGDSSPSTVLPCREPDREAALRWIHDGMDEGERPAFIDALGKVRQTGLDGLLCSYRNDALTGALLVQPAAGNSAVVWLGDPAAPDAAALLAAAAQFVDRRGFGLGQALAGRDDAWRELLPAAGFPQLAKLVYLFATASAAETPPPARVEFHPQAGRDSARLGRLLQRTYEGSLDCPALEGVRPMGDVLAGYAAQGTHLPEQWYRVECDDRDAGALLLAGHADSGNWELVYVGVAPEFRGQRLGETIVRHALACAAAGGAERLVLAVDAANKPALTMYAACGFTEWDRRAVYARLSTMRSS